MRIETLKNPGVISSGLQLRTQAAKAISAAEIHLDAEGKQTLTDFFTDCAVKAGGTPSAGVSTSAYVASGVAIAVPVTGTYTTEITPTVVNGVITGFVLS